MISVAIFTEGGKKYGYGHISRCKALLQAFDHLGFEVRMVIDGDESALNNASSYTILNWKNESLTSLTNNDDIIVFDSYYFDAAKESKNLDEHKTILVIQDHQDCDESNDHFILAPISSKGFAAKNVLSGIEYALLRKSFWQTPEIKISEEIKRILIIPGSGLSNSFLKSIIETAHYKFTNASIYYVGPENDFPDFIEKYTHLSENEIRGIMTSSDLALTAGGQTLNELMVLGIPSLVFQTAENQKEQIAYWRNAGTITYFDITEGFNQNKFEVLLTEYSGYNFRKQVSEQSKLLIDGLGGIRIAKIMVNDFVAKNGLLRVVEAKDCWLLYDISNHPSIREISLNPDPISKQTHQSWFEKALSNPNLFYYCLELKNEIIGQIRYEIGSEEAEISLSVHPKYSGFGIGQVLFNKSLNLLLKSANNLQKIIAQVKEDNQPSIRFFEKNSFEKVERKGVLTYELNL
ncbi:MAG: GNAT family N-acetyltransferase [Bacteroidota bacterium]